MQKNCPKCGHKPRADDPLCAPGVCPACGIAIAKWRARQVPSSAAKGDSPSVDDGFSVRAAISWRARLWQLASYCPEQVDPLLVGLRALAWLAALIWGGYFMLSGIDWQVIGGSFLHNINLAFHEAGHLLFSPFGRFMAILGGSLFQVLLPLFLVGVFLYPHHSQFLGDSATRSRRSSFSASLMLWWAGQSLIDVSPYILDAKARALPLILGMGEESHDWGNLLRMTNSLDSAEALAHSAFNLGALLIIVSLIWGAYLLNIQWQRRSR